MVPTTTVNLTDHDSTVKVLNVIDKLEELDDVQKVYANFEVSEEIIQNATQ